MISLKLQSMWHYTTQQVVAGGAQVASLDKRCRQEQAGTKMTLHVSDFSYIVSRVLHTFSSLIWYRGRFWF